MWNNFCAVVEDLFWFAFGVERSNEIVVYGEQHKIIHLRAKTPAVAGSVRAPSEPVFLAAPAVPTLLPQTTNNQSLTAHSTPVMSVPLPIIKNELAEENHDEQKAAILHAPVVMYVKAKSGTACIHSPQIDFDAVIQTLPYGTAVTVIGYQGRFASVNRSNITGWVNKDDITPHKNDVWPAFVSGHEYGADHVCTLRTRLLIEDMFAAGQLQLPLQAGEYITVRLAAEHRTITWSRKRPRVTGAWATLLKGASGIHIGVTPKTDTIMEWQEGNGEGRLGYVEAVAPDLSVTISAVGVEEAGLYTVKTMSEEIWRELRPVFIEVA